MFKFLKSFKIYLFTDIDDELHVKTQEVNQFKRYISRQKHFLSLNNKFCFYKIKHMTTYSLSRRNDLCVDPGILSPEEKGEGKGRHILVAEGIGSITSRFWYTI